ncbi:DUF3784 domain-containing protein [Fictibacillus iocasae]|uniref:DUF3784 domain-containing protein n=1 Tax=Fictibacillus iocasae TaxID=2715437 RepID=A0ABW2NPB1_9BACL
MLGAFINFIFVILFFTFALILSKGKGAFLLSGYNTMSNEEKTQYDEAALCQFMSKIMYGISLSILLFAVSELLENQTIFIIGLIFMLSLILFALLYVNTNNRFKKVK